MHVQEWSKRLKKPQALAVELGWQATHMGVPKQQIQKLEL